MVVLVICFALLIGTNMANAKTVYDDQPPMSEKELLSFIELLPRFRAWAASNREEAAPGITDGKADFTYSDKAAAWIKSRGWEADHFFSVMGRAAAALFIVAEGNGVNSSKPTDMPSVTQSELELVRKNLAALLRAGSDAPPIN